MSNMNFGKKEVEKVSTWVKSSKDGDEYVSEDKRMHIWNIGKENETMIYFESEEITW